MNLIIFDFDDTLVDNTQMDFDSFQKICKKFKLAMVSQQTIVNWRKNGMLAKNIFKRILKNKEYPSLETCIKERLDYLSRGGGGINLLRSKPLAKLTLKKIKNHRNFVIIVTTRKNKLIVKKILKRLGLEKFVDRIYTPRDCKYSSATMNDYVELKLKLYNLVLSNFKKKIKKVVVVGNLKSDVIAAKKLNITALAVKGSYRWDSGISKNANPINALPEILNFL